MGKLCFKLRERQTIYIGENVKVYIYRDAKNSRKIAIEAPQSLNIFDDKGKHEYNPKVDKWISELQAME